MLRAAETVQLTDTGRQRRGNEDSAYARAPLFVVADGMGGAQAGEVASHLAIEVFEQGLPEDGTPEERLSVVVQRANREIYDRARGDSELNGMGTTVTAVYLTGDEIAVAHVGDSRAYRFRDDELTRLTDDHSLVEELLRGGKLTEEEALEHPQRSIITRALGPEPIVEVDTLTYAVRAGDVFLLCSDGLTSMIPERLVEQVLQESPSLPEAGQRLIDEANAAGGRDNITVVLFRVEEVGGAVDQPTMVSTAAVAAAETGGDSVPGPTAAPGAPAASPAASAATVRAARLARTQGPPGPPVALTHNRKFGRLGKTVTALFTIAIVVFLVGGGGYLATRQLYFVGTDAQGTVVVYRGFPYTLPFGIPMYESFYVSGVPASLIPKDRRSTLLNHQLRSQTAAQNLINDIELGKISG
jgi:PPM family protein phosphatase